jgi:hypothetical protein
MMIDNAFPVQMGGNGGALGFLQQYIRGAQDYSQAGEGIPDFRLQDQYAQEMGGPLFGETLISGDPSFDLRMPKTPAGQSFEGVPNASPEMLRKLMERKIKNPGGQELPGFLKGA